MDHDDYEERYHIGEKVDILNRGYNGIDPDRFRTFDDSEDEDRYYRPTPPQRSSYTTSFHSPVSSTQEKAGKKSPANTPSKPIPIPGNQAVNAMLQKASERLEDLSPVVPPHFPYTQGRSAQGVASKDFAAAGKNDNASLKSGGGRDGKATSVSSMTLFDHGSESTSPHSSSGQKQYYAAKAGEGGKRGPVSKSEKLKAGKSAGH